MILQSCLSYQIIGIKTINDEDNQIILFKKILDYIFT